LFVFIEQIFENLVQISRDQPP